MADGPVLFLDSGIGGLPYVEAVRRYVPHAQLIYVADTAHFPYGERDGDEIRRIMVELVEAAVESFAPQLIVVACNTATVVALETLRRRFDVPFVGVVPAVKPAALSAAGGTITVLSTARTADAEYLARLIESFAGNTEVRIVAAGDLVSFVEHRFAETTADERHQAVSEILGRAGADWEQTESVVLGCTHFTHLAGEIQQVLGPAIEVVDSREGVARRVGELLSPAGGGLGPAVAADAPAPAVAADESGASVAVRPRGDEFWLTDETAGGEAGRKRYRTLAARYGLSYNGLYSWTHTH
ncbi:MAG: glutamate racemase [Spirochaetota bacterium]